MTMNEKGPEPSNPLANDVSEQMQIRLAKRAKLLETGRQAYPVGVPVTRTISSIRQQYDGTLQAADTTGDMVGIAGRVVFIRNTGKLCFASLQQGEGTRIQAMISLAGVGQEALDDWKSLVDLGDHVFVHGEVISSRRGELSVFADSWQMASKALRPMPVLHKELSDETRTRQPYLDLMVRQKARDLVRTRAKITQTVRDVLNELGYIEVETPILQLIHGGATARPFETHLNAFDQKMTLRIATELFLKRAVVGGIDRVYEIGRVFRNEGIDSSHSPEFTTLECYEAYADQFVMAQRMQQIILACAQALDMYEIQTDKGKVDLRGQWRWLEVYPGLSEAVGQTLTPQTPLADLQAIARAHQVKFDPQWSAEKMIIELFGELVEPQLIAPTFVYNYPPLAQPLARPHRDEPRLIEAWDLIIGGMERGTAFSELIDPVVQRQRLMEQSMLAADGDPEAMQLDEDFLRALEYAAPPMGGMGVGIGRLIMLITGVGIRESILFPLMKPEISDQQN